MKRSVMQVLVACCLTGAVPATARAQEDDRPGQPERERPARAVLPAPLTPEQMRAAWELQARFVAGELKLDGKQTAALAKAYSEARQAHIDELEKLRVDRPQPRPEDGDQPVRQRMRDLQERIEALTREHRTKLQAALKGTLNEEQLARAVTSLGTFNRAWDLLTHTVASFNLQPGQQTEAMRAIEQFVIAQDKARAETDPEKRRADMQEHRRRLVEAMRQILTEEQFGQFQAAFGRGMMGGPRGPGEGRRLAPPPEDDTGEPRPRRPGPGR